jgi:hypothetical protein
VLAIQIGDAGWGAAYTDASGAYTIPGLPTGTYEVTAEIEGWATGRMGAVAVTWGGNITVDFQLDPSAIRVSHTYPAGWNLISLPVRPEDPSPATVFGAIPISGRLHRYDTTSKAYVTYYDFAPGPFGQVKSGEGYWLYLDTGATFTYWGFPNNGTQTIPLAAHGWSLLGHPFRTSALLADCDVRQVSDGVIKTFAQAVTAGWIEQPLYTWDAGLLGYHSCGLDVPPYQHDRLRPWLGYWASTGLGEVDLMVPMP